MRPPFSFKVVQIGRIFCGTLLVIACLAALTFTVRLAAQPKAGGASKAQAAETDVASAQETKKLEQTAEKLRDEAEKLREESSKLQTFLAEERREADDFRWLLTVVIGLGALYSLFQAVYSYLNVQELKAQAQKTIDNVETLRKDTAAELKTFQKEVKATAEEDFRNFRKECETQFPMFIGFERALGHMSSQLEALLKTAAIGDNFYRMLDDSGRQEIYYYEKSVASLQFVEVSSPGRLFHIFRGFSRFYLDKYRHDRTPDAGAADRDDLSRARYYLYRADVLPAGGKDFRVLNEHGYMAVRAEAKPDLAEAKRYFEKSAELKPDQQCAHYNLARIDHVTAAGLKTSDPAEAKRLLKAAVDRLRIARGYPNWEDTPLPKKSTSIDYNFACGLAQLSTLESDAGVRDGRLKESFEALERAVQKAPEERTQFDKDREPGGDLHPLAMDARYKAKLDDMAALIRKARG